MRIIESLEVVSVDVVGFFTDLDRKFYRLTPENQQLSLGQPRLTVRDKHWNIKFRLAIQTTIVRKDITIVLNAFSKVDKSTTRRLLKLAHTDHAKVFLLDQMVYVLQGDMI